MSVIASLMYANGLKKILEAILYEACDHCTISLDLKNDRGRLEAALKVLGDIESPAIAVLQRHLAFNRLKQLENDQRRKANLEILQKAKVKPTQEWFDKILADHNSRINEGNFKRKWWSAA